MGSRRVTSREVTQVVLHEIHATDRCSDGKPFAQRKDRYVAATTTRPNLMNRFLKACLAISLKSLGALAATALIAANAGAAAPSVNEGDLVKLGFKVLVATTKVQQDWVRQLAPGKFRPLQRNGKKFVIYPEAAKTQIYVGGPAEYDAYLKLHPEARQSMQDVANKENAYRGKQAAAMQAATAHDLSDPFLGATWADLGW